MTQVNEGAILALTAKVECLANAAPGLGESAVIFYPIMAPYEIEYVMIMSEVLPAPAALPANGIDVRIVDTGLYSPVRIKYEVIENPWSVIQRTFVGSVGANVLFDNLLKAIPMGEVFVTFENTENKIQAANVVVTGNAIDSAGLPSFTLYIYNKDAVDPHTFDVEVGYRPINRVVDVEPILSNRLNLDPNLSAIVRRTGSKLTGFVSIVAGSVDLNGTSTLFLSELNVGDVLIIGDIEVAIGSIGSNTVATLNGPSPATFSLYSARNISTGQVVGTPATYLNGQAT